jgi:flagellin
MINPALPPDLVHVNTLGIAKGTFSITTPVPGAEIVLAGDETLMKALSLVEVLEAKAPIHSISAYDMDTAQSIGRLVTDTDEIVGLIPGVKIFFDNTAGMMLDPQPPTDINGGPNSMGSFPFMQALERPRVSLSARLESFFMHVAAREFSLQIGANKNQTLSNYIGDQSAKALGIEGLLIADAGLSQDAISIIDTAIQRVSTQRGRLGAMQNRLESTVRNIDIAAENLTNAESRIRDADIARETMIATRNEILLQAGVAALAQANQLPQAVLQLLR